MSIFYNMYKKIQYESYCMIIDLDEPLKEFETKTRLWSGTGRISALADWLS